MKNLLIILALLVPSLAIAQDPFAIEPTKAAASADVADSKSSMDDYNLSQIVDDLMERVATLEANQLNEKDVEAIAEKVFKRMTIVVNKADGGQELKTVEGRLSDGSVLKTTLEPGQTFATAIDPYTGQIVTLGKPTMVQVPKFEQPVKQWEFDSFTVRQSPPLQNGQSILGIQLGSQCYEDANGNTVCPNMAARAPAVLPARQATSFRATTTTRPARPRLFGRW